MKIECNLYSEWITSIREAMTNAGFDHSKLTDQDCAVRWCAWERRIISPAKRSILKAKEFQRPAKLHRGLNQLEHAFIRGAYIWPWQSKLIDSPAVEDEDGLYNDYGVAHFHLGTVIALGGFVKRGNELLFALVNSSTVYEIGIYTHGDWYELDILDIIDANWPHLLTRVTIPAADLRYCLKTREEVKQARKAHLNTFIKLNSGRIISPPGGGVALNGTSNEAVFSAINAAKILQDGEKLITADIIQRIQKGSLEEKDYTIHLHIANGEVSGVTEDGHHKWILWKARW